MGTHTDTTARLRLLQLSSPGLPVGAFAYSQGLEWAVEAGWVTDQDSTANWLQSLLHGNIACLDVPFLKRFFLAFTADDPQRVRYWCQYAAATRETQELRDEDRHRAAAFTRLLADFPVPDFTVHEDAFKTMPLAPYAYAAFHFGICLHDAALGHIWSWLENLVTAAMKLVPLGQTQGQRLLLDLGAQVDGVIRRGLDLDDDEIGHGAPAMVLASCQHETQYTRLFRS